MVSYVFSNVNCLNCTLAAVPIAEVFACENLTTLHMVANKNLFFSISRIPLHVLIGRDVVDLSIRRREATWDSEESPRIESN